MQRSALCRSRRELLNAYFLAKFRFDAAENEPPKVCPIEPGLQRSIESTRPSPGGEKASALVLVLRQQALAAPAEALPEF